MLAAVHSAYDDGMPSRTLDAEVEDGVARLTLSRPAVGNAIDLELARDLASVTAEWSTNRTIRVVVLRGAGTRFCVGGDLKAFAAQEDLPAHLTEVTSHLHAAISRLARLPAPVVAAVHGSAAGAGFSLACSADVVLAAASTKFVLAYRAVGLTPDGGGTWYLPRLAGLRRALDLALTNRPLGAAEAEQMGVVSRVVPDDELDAATEAVVHSLATGPAAALAATKRLLRSSLEQSLESQLASEAEALVAAVATADGREGITAFLAKRPARFDGP
jgi:2-(1,2-epoxy-1,2-dihydrophenyl)acetyl-CoA isomerase